MEFRILGPLDVADDRLESIPIAGQKQRALLAILLLRANEVVSRERLVEELWGEQPPKTATASLQNSISQLRKLLGPGRLVTKPPGYVLRVEADELDLHRFERALREARELAPDERAAALEQALALWRGPALADFEFESFAQTEARRLEELRLAALENRIDAELERGRAAEVAGELEALVAEHPQRERLRGQLMLALYGSGRQADALRAYQETRRMLVDELGVDPSPQLQELHAQILRQEVPRPSYARDEVADEDHFAQVAAALLAGRLVPVLGAPVDRLAERLARRFDYPANGAGELTRVAQYVALTRGSGPLYDELHELLAPSLEPTAVHRFLAALPQHLRERGAPHQLIVTTGYDLALEQAFLAADEEFDVVSYVPSGPDRGRFCHLDPRGDAQIIEVPNTYATELSLERRTVILKLHGGVDEAAAREHESFVVTEDDYIDYLGRNDVGGAIPVGLAAKLRRSHFLFLGFGMHEWA